MSALAQHPEDLVFGHFEDVATLALQHVVEVIRLSDEHEVCWVVLVGLSYAVPDAVIGEDARVFSKNVALDLVEMHVANRPVGSLFVLGDEECHETVIMFHRCSKNVVDYLALNKFTLLLFSSIFVVLCKHERDCVAFNFLIHVLSVCLATLHGISHQGLTGTDSSIGGSL